MDKKMYHFFKKKFKSPLSLKFAPVETDFFRKVLALTGFDWIDLNRSTHLYFNHILLRI